MLPGGYTAESHFHRKGTVGYVSFPPLRLEVDGFVDDVTQDLVPRASRAAEAARAASLRSAEAAFSLEDVMRMRGDVGPGLQEAALALDEAAIAISVARDALARSTHLRPPWIG